MTDSADGSHLELQPQLFGYARVIKAGDGCQLQDWGRQHAQYYGFAEGGAADGFAYHWANQLLDNHRDAAVIEITLGPFCLEFSEACSIAICGADMRARLDGETIRNWHSHRVSKGSRLEMGLSRSGLRAYIAIAGGLSTEIFLSSVCRVMHEDLEIPTMPALKANDKLKYKAQDHPIRTTRGLSAKYIPSYDDSLELELFPSYQFANFSDIAKKALFNHTFTVSPHSNRMGYRLEGIKIDAPEMTMESEGIAYGAVQIPPDGSPIILLSDRQTIGGYPKIGCLSRESAWALSQRRPGQKVSFTLRELN